MSHEDPFEVIKFACYLPSIYGKNLTVKYGKVHDYLGMHLDHSEEVTAKVPMIKYAKKVLKAFPEEIKAISVTLSVHVE